MSDREIKKLAKYIAAEIMELQKEQSVWLTAEQTAARLGISVRTLYNRKSEIGFVKRGKKIYFKENNINSFIEKR